MKGQLYIGWKSLRTITGVLLLMSMTPTRSIAYQLEKPTLTIRISEAGIDRPVPGLSVVLQDETTGKSLPLSYESAHMTATVRVEPDHRYTVAIDAPGYTPYRKYIDKVPISRELSVQLPAEATKANVKEYTFVVTDKEQHSVVPTAKITVFDASDLGLQVQAMAGRYVVALPTSGIYRYEVEAPEYFSEKGKIESSMGKIITVGLKRRPVAETQTVTFIALDDWTDKPIAARFRLMAAGRATSATITTAAHPEFGTELKIKENYQLEVSADGYAPYLEAVQWNRALPNHVEPLKIRMLPLGYNISFTVLDAATMEKIQPSEFIISEKNKPLNVRKANGIWQVYLAPETNYEVVVTQKGYERFARTLSIEKPISPKDVQKTILLGKTPPKRQPSAVASVSAKPEIKSTPVLEKTSTVDSLMTSLTVGDKVVLKTVFFDQSSYIIRPEVMPELNALVRMLKTNPELEIQLEGHTDNTGDPRLNQYLSEHRAKVLHSYLINHGVEENRVSWKGLGGSQPIAPNDTEENKAKNRRVEYKILKK